MEFINKIKSLILQFNTPDNLGEVELVQGMNEPEMVMFQKLMEKAIKRKRVGFISGILFGHLGVHRYYLGDYVTGAIYTVVALITISINESLAIIPYTAAWIECLSIMDKIDQYNRAQALDIAQKVQEYGKLEEEKEAEKERLIAQFPNLVPVNYNGKLVAAALVDQTIHIVDQVERKRSIYSVLGSCTTSGEFIILRLIVRNDSKKTRTISASMMTLIDPEGRQFSTSSEGTTALTMSGDKTAEFLVTEIQPGLEKSITIVFEVPSTSQDLQLEIPSGVFGKSVILPLSLAT